MQKLRKYELTHELLESYQNSALNNSAELIEEAKLLYKNGKYARAYFLALASIEESGKSYLAFEAKGRNLSDGGVCKKIKEQFEDHSSKITAAFVGWLHNLNYSRESIEKVVELSFQLKLGRESSMYIDVKQESEEISVPSEVVRPVAANDCISVATNCLYHTRNYISLRKPETRTTFNDKFMCINKNSRMKILNQEEFWHYFLEELKKGNVTLDEVIVKYHDGKYNKSKHSQASIQPK